MASYPSPERLFDYCSDTLQQRIDELQATIHSVQQSANGETKSTAGDKHETARAMAQLEVEMLSRQLSESQKSLQNLQNIRSKVGSESIAPGSLVVTSMGIFYLSVSLGKANVDGTDLLIISPEAPIAKVLIGKKAGDSAAWNGNTLTIQRVS